MSIHSWRIQKSLWLLAFCSGVAMTSFAALDFLDAKNACATELDEQCTIFVRLIAAKRSADDSPEPAAVSSYLQDVSAQLAPLPLTDYQTLDSGTAEVPFGKEAFFRLRKNEGKPHTIRVVPHQMTGGRVQLTVDWKNPRGENLVSTMLRVPNGENVMLGDEGSDSTCALVGVKVSCGEIK